MTAPTPPESQSSEQIPSPREYMKARHPDLFSDSEDVQDTVLAETTLEFHLEGLTARKQEYDFENFARKLAEREICSNLVPQTGPVGGGDSKADTITHPTAEGLAERWYFGNAASVGDKRWAFAISTKKKWRDKVNSDVAKLAAIPRRPELIYFISSQLIKDKDRADAEDKLTEKHGIPIHILDRTWIVRRVIDRGHHQLAIDTLHIHVQPVARRRVGAQDASRTAEFEELVERLKSPAENYPSDYLLAEDYLAAAELARALGRPRHEVDGLFQHAERAASNFKHTGQIARVLYSEAWTAFFWHEDRSALNDAYGKLEQLLSKSTDAPDFELASNLWALLLASEEADLVRFKVAERAASLKAALKKLAGDQARPGNAAHAKTLLHLHTITTSGGQGESARAALTGLRECLEEGAGLVAYPASSFVHTIVGMGAVIGSVPGYRELFDFVSGFAEKREGEEAKGILQLTRGMQAFKQGRPVETVRYLSEARLHLAKHETRYDSARAMLVCGLAYEQLGLSWAARLQFLYAANVYMRLRETTPAVRQLAVRAAMKMVWIELRLGRTPCVLAWYQACGLWLQAVIGGTDTPAAVAEERTLQDGVVGLLLLMSDDSTLRHLTGLVAALDGVGLHWARSALLYALGQVANLKREQLPIAFTEEAELDAFYSKAFQQPAINDLPTRQILHVEQKESYETILYGCRIVLVIDTEPSTIIAAEILLSVLEEVLAAASFAEVAIPRGTLTFRLRASDAASNPPPISVRKDGTFDELVVARDFDQWLRSGHPDELTAWAHEAVALFVAVHGIFKGGADGLLSRMAERGAFNSAAMISSLVPAVDNTVGFEAYFVDRWERLFTNAAPFSVLRPRPWHEGIEKPRPVAAARTVIVEEGFIDHRRSYSSDLIDIRQWDRAGFAGVMFTWAEDNSQDPGIGLIFKNIEDGRRAFEKMRESIGDDDAQELLRISIVEGLPDGGYAFQIGPNMATIDVLAAKQGRAASDKIFMASRLITMKPGVGTKLLLPMFKQSYAKTQRYLFFPVEVNQAGETMRHLDLAIVKRDIALRSFAEIDTQSGTDPDSIIARPQD